MQLFLNEISHLELVNVCAGVLVKETNYNKERQQCENTRISGTEMQVYVTALCEKTGQYTRKCMGTDPSGHVKDKTVLEGGYWNRTDRQAHRKSNGTHRGDGCLSGNDCRGQTGELLCGCVFRAEYVFSAIREQIIRCGNRIKHCTLCLSQKNHCEIKRVLKDDGVLIAPTFTHQKTHFP